MLYVNYYYFLIVVIAGAAGLDEDTIQPGSGFVESDNYPTDYSTDIDNIEELLKGIGEKKDGTENSLVSKMAPEDIGEKKPKDDSNNNMVLVIIIIVLLAFILLGVF